VSQLQKVKGDKHAAHTFDFLGFTHYGGHSRKGNWMLCRQTSAKKFRKACKALSAWLRQTRCLAKLSQWWPTLQAKLAGHYPACGILLLTGSLFGECVQQAQVGLHPTDRERATTYHLKE